MRQISISIDVFSKIWSERHHGEDSEDQILRRILGLNEDGVTTSAIIASAETSAGADDHRPGFYDTRNEVRFEEGFEIFRRFKGSDYRARVVDGAWKLLRTGESFLSLNALSIGIGAYENAWFGWRYRDKRNQEKFINELRHWSKEGKRPTRISEFAAPSGQLP